ncbi:MAG TPA: N-acetylmuramoyl-L-alanine amidase [Solirubrobacteraceae bacterium]|nr:N-acetylmuramoyl-L-alanine amidase [Solirubrobacteraceae bacterium]
MSAPQPRGFTRRDVLGAATAAAGAGVLLSPGAAVARADAAPVFSRWVGDLAGTSPALATGRRFVMAGLEWSGPPGARIELRARPAGGRWSPWALASVQGHEPDRPPRGSTAYGEPLWLGPADEIQLRSSRGLSGVRVRFVAADAVGEAADSGAAVAAALGPTATAAALPLAQPILDAGPGQPPIIARSAWAGRNHGPAAGPYYGAINLAFVHHTDNPNGYSAGQVPALILAIYLYHRYSRGFFDIAYNFVIDAFGRIWEARAGGIDEPVIGAHAGGYNAESTGVAVLGTFMFAVPPPAAMSALQRLLAWKLSLHGIPTLGKVRVEVDPADAFYTPFAPGQRVLLPRIAGHRDGDLTDCPGDDLYARLPGVRTQAHALAVSPALLTLTAAQTAVGPSTSVTLSGRLTGLDDGAPLAGAPLAIQMVAGVGKTTTIAQLTTADDGTWSTAVTPAQSLVLRALHAVAPAAVSDLVLVSVVPAITLSLISPSPLRVSGTVTPAKRRVTLDVYKLSGGRRHLVLSRTVTARRGEFAARLSLGRRPAHGTYAIVARTALDDATAAGASPAVQVAV